MRVDTVLIRGANSQSNYPYLLREIESCIKNIDKEQHKNKISQEKTTLGKILYSPQSLNMAFKIQLEPKRWIHNKQNCNYTAEYYTAEYYTEEYLTSSFIPSIDGAFRDMDFVKDKLGVEVQFGKYSFMVYNVCAKMTIFKNLGVIDAGIEIVPVKELAKHMSSGVSYFEQFVWDLETRRVSNIDIPVLVLGAA